MLDCKLECVWDCGSQLQKWEKSDNYWGFTATRRYTFSCTSVMPTRKAVQTAITVVCVIVLSAHHK